MADDRKTDLVLFFIFLTLAMTLLSYLFRGYIPDLANNVLDRPEGTNVTALQFAGAMLKLMVFSVSADLYIISIIIDAYAFIGMYLVISYVLNR